MAHRRITRRNLLTGARVTLAVPALLEASASAPSSDPAESIARLKEGNKRFAAGKTRHAHAGADWRKQLVEGQKPFATILGCSDSRVPVELVFDQGFGDLFVIRVAGNVVAPDVVGSLAYAIEHLATPLIVVLGHEGCGAVAAAVEALKKPTEEHPGIKALIEMIAPGLPKMLPGTTPDEQNRAAVEANVRWSLSQLKRQPGAKTAIDDLHVRLIGAVYELATGRVRFL